MPKKIPYKLKGHYDSFENPDAYAELYSYPQRDRDYDFRADAIQSVDDPALLSELLGYDATPYEDASYDFEPTPTSTSVTEPTASLVPQKKPTAGPVQFASDAMYDLSIPTSQMSYRMPDNADALLEKLWYEESLRYPSAPFNPKHPYGHIPGWPLSVPAHRDGDLGSAAKLLLSDADERIPSRTMAYAMDMYNTLKAKGELPLDSYEPIITHLGNTGIPSDPTNFNSNAGSAAQKAAGLAEDLGELPRQFRKIGWTPDWARSPETGMAYPDVLQQLHGNGQHFSVDNSMPYLGHLLPDLASSLLRRGRNAMVNAPQLAKDGAKLVSLFKKLT